MIRILSTEEKIELFKGIISQEKTKYFLERDFTEAFEKLSLPEDLQLFDKEIRQAVVFRDSLAILCLVHGKFTRLFKIPYIYKNNSITRRIIISAAAYKQQWDLGQQIIDSEKTLNFESSAITNYYLQKGDLEQVLACFTKDTRSYAFKTLSYALHKNNPIFEPVFNHIVKLAMEEDLGKDWNGQTQRWNYHYILSDLLDKDKPFPTKLLALFMDNFYSKNADKLLPTVLHALANHDKFEYAGQIFKRALKDAEDNKLSVEALQGMYGAILGHLYHRQDYVMLFQFMRRCHKLAMVTPLLSEIESKGTMFLKANYMTINARILSL